MRHEKKAVLGLAAAALCASMITGSALAAQNESNFSALEGVTAQTLSAQEMQSISGELNAYSIADALTADAATLSSTPKLQSVVLKAANYFTTNATQINAFFQKLGVLTPYTAP